MKLKESDMGDDKLVQFCNCTLLRDHQVIKDDLWIRSGKIVNPEHIFYQEGAQPDHRIDCQGALITPGFIDVQINGGFGVDFSHNSQNIEAGVSKVRKGVLAYGVTSFCPTVVSSYPSIYKRILPYLGPKEGSAEGAEILGAHVEGPFISPQKKGAHDEATFRDFQHGMKEVEDVYCSLENIKIITLAPELPNAMKTIGDLTERGILVSIGHSMATISEGEESVRRGVRFITHLFNAMLPFHHRDPGIVGLLASQNLSKNENLYYGIIADGNHTHPATTRIAYRAHPKGIILVTDACSAMGLTEGIHHIGELEVEVIGTKAVLEGTNTLAGSVATMISCIQYFWKTTGCSIVEAVEAATLHPAQLLKIEKKKGTLDFNTDADFVLLNPESLHVRSTWINGKCVFESD